MNSKEMVTRLWELANEMGRRGVCSPNLRALMPQFAEFELQRRQIMRDLAGLERRMCMLLADARMVRDDTRT